MLTVTLVLSALLIVVDVYTFRGLKMLIKDVDSLLVKGIFNWGYWTLTCGMLALLYYSLGNFSSAVESHSYRIPFTVASIFMIYLSPKLIFIVFQLIEDLSFLSYWGVKRIVSSSETVEIMSRSEFLLQTVSKVGLG
ncbi:MAG: hypothetical protein JKY42_04665, partial [Flavobacteriales bacterium]|nr:hypothetical protein [Flavobacteriales bacterium]